MREDDEYISVHTPSYTKQILEVVWSPVMVALTVNLKDTEEDDQ